MDILESLNDKQKEAVVQTEGPLLILAGAGSGKTKTLTHRVAYLIYDKKVPGGSIMAVTFTNKAAQEMRERISALLRMDARNTFSSAFFHPHIPVIGTFHSICSKILRKEIEVLGRDRDFHITDTSEQIAIIKRIVKDIGLDPKQFAPKSFLSAISHAKNHLMDAKKFSQQAQGYIEEITTKVYERYEQALLENEALDFDDLLLVTVKIFKEYPLVLEKYQRQFRYLLVDEYQDTNQVQYRLITMLAKRHRNICVVGDDWQSIYAFRGADIRNILEFEKDYPDAKIVHLEQNYRSTQTILDAAHGIISQNTNRKEKKLWTQSQQGEKIVVYESEDEIGEANYVAGKIEELAEKGISYKDCAVLYRTNAQSRALEESFLDREIPYKIVGGLKFYERKEIRDMVAYLRFLRNPSDLMALDRIVNEPKRGIGKKTLATWMERVRKEEKDPLEIGKNALEGVVVPSKKKVIELFCSWVEGMQKQKEDLTLSDWVQSVYEKSGYEAMLRKAVSSENEARRENVNELIGALKRYDKMPLGEALDLFLEEVALVADSDQVETGGNIVHCMTMHSAKGLEFGHIFIVGVEENILPHSRSALSQLDLEEERRLMYVGVTRAKIQASLVYARHRMLFGSVQANPPSRFLEEIPQELILRSEQKEGNYLESVFEGKNSFLQQKSQFHGKKEIKKEGAVFGDGDHVEHRTFGSGIVVSQDDAVYTIIFQKEGIKKIAKSADVFKKK